MILGGGFGGANCVSTLEERLKPDEADIFLIDRNNYFVFTPLLVEAGIGSVEPRHAVVPIRKFLRRSQFIMGHVTGVDARQGQVSFRVTGGETEQRMAYDHLIVALGSVTMRPPVPGLAEFGYEMKSLGDAVHLRDRAIHLLERANVTPDPEARRALLHFVIVGANLNGVEIAGEFHAFLQDAAKRVYRNVSVDECTVTIVELIDQILAGMKDPDLSDFAARHLTERGIRIRLKTTVTEVRRDHVVLSTGEHLPTFTVIWAAGIAPSPVLKDMGLPTDQRGYVLTEPDMRVRGYENVWAIGDAAVNMDGDGRPYPATAQHAVRQGRQLGANVARALHGEATEPCRIRSLGTLAALGRRTGVAKILGVKLAGFSAWFIWRSVYLLKMPGWGRRLRVALDWTLSLLFNRDVVQLGLHRTKR